MPDHLHLLIGIDGNTPLSDIVRDFKRIMARTTSIKWQRNYFDHRVRKDESLAEKVDYILNNPVRAGARHMRQGMAIFPIRDDSSK